MRRVVLLAAVVLGLGAPPAAAFTVIGPSNPPNPGFTQAVNFPNPSIWFTASAPVGTRLLTPSAGVITRWRLYTGDVFATATARLRLLEPVDADTWRFFGGPSEQVLPIRNTPNATRHTFERNFEVPAGRMFGVEIDHPDGPFEISLPVGCPPGVWRYGYVGPPLPADGTTADPILSSTTGCGQYVGLSLDFELDADGDGFGDDSEDRCPGTAGSDRGCRPGTFDRGTTRAPGEAVVTTVAPADALAVLDSSRIAFGPGRRTLTVPVSCPASRTCAGELAARTTRRIGGRRLSLGRSAFSVAAGASRSVALRVPTATRRALARTRRPEVTVTLGRATTLDRTVR